MKKSPFNKIQILLILFITSFNFIAKSQSPALIGYWHNWNDQSCPYIPLDQIDTRYNVIVVSFATPTSPSDMNMNFIPDMVSQSTFINQIQTLKNQGKKVLISIGGANTSIDVTTTENKNAFVSSMISIVNTYGFDGIDIDVEHGNSVLASGTVANTTNPATVNFISAIQEIMSNFMTIYSHKMFLTMAPETAYVQGGQAAFGVIWGGYLSIIDALRNELDILQVQLYNSGSMNGIDNNEYFQGTADFIIAMTEAVIHGFNTQGGYFQGLPANKVAVGLPACSSAAGGGYTTTLEVKSAMDYLLGNGPKPGSYTLNNNEGYPDLRGMMTWSINWDALSTCGSSYEYAQNFETIFTGGIITPIVPTITWNNPTDISYGTPLTSIQLNASANVPGTFTYSPPIGSVLSIGTHELNVVFSPYDAVTYTNASKTVQINIVSNNANLSDIQQNNFSTYPNPADNVLLIPDNLEDVNIFDIVGNEINVQFSASNQINVTEFSNGTYFLKSKQGIYRFVIKH